VSENEEEFEDLKGLDGPRLLPPDLASQLGRLLEPGTADVPELRRIDAPRKLPPRLRARLADRLSPRRRKSVPWWWQMSVAASIVMLITGMLFFLRGDQRFGHGNLATGPLPTPSHETKSHKPGAQPSQAPHTGSNGGRGLSNQGTNQCAALGIDGSEGSTFAIALMSDVIPLADMQTSGSAAPDARPSPKPSPSPRPSEPGSRALGLSLKMTATPSGGEPGETLTIYYAVTNTGRVTLSDVEIVDSNLGKVGVVPTLARGETRTFGMTTQFTNEGPLSFNGTVSATHGSKTVTGKATVNVSLVLGVTKLPPPAKTSC
jgi:hypothetical protein